MHVHLIYCFGFQNFSCRMPHALQGNKINNHNNHCYNLLVSIVFILPHASAAELAQQSEIFQICAYSSITVRNE